eukprot:6689814-Heterocapsa_arctica.AAC.1
MEINNKQQYIGAGRGQAARPPGSRAPGSHAAWKGTSGRIGPVFDWSSGILAITIIFLDI